jgi:predicted AlkP superfamily pyrophosphatase or phosphodiesterase
MKNKVILVSIDGMRPDGVMQCGNPFVEELMKTGSYTLNARTVFPSVTLPCHTSMFHSVTPERHGITTNDYVPQVRPIKGLFEQISNAGGKCAMFYGWEPLRDVSRPGSLIVAEYQNAYSADNTDRILTEKAIKVIDDLQPDFVFLYMVETDEKGGHDNGWMSEEYLRRISIAVDNVKRMIQQFGSEYSFVIMADHGGHERSHGSTLPEDMTIPLFFYGPAFEGGSVLEGLSLLDIAPTIAKILDVAPDPDWEGHSVI